MTKDYYEILGIKRGASQEEIKLAYKNLAKKFHPDNPKTGNIEKMQEVNEAHDALTSSNSFDPSSSRFNERHFAHNYNDSGLENIFDTFGRDKFFKKKPNKKIETFIEITLEEAFSGIQSNINVVNLPDNTYVENVSVLIPAGVRNNNVLLLKVASPNGKIYDLCLKIKIKPHKVFSLINNDLHVTLEINSIQAMVGDSLTFNTLNDETFKLNVPAGIAYGQKLKIANKGWKKSNNGVERGDLIATINIKTPKLTKDQKESLKNLNFRLDESD